MTFLSLLFWCHKKSRFWYFSYKKVKYIVESLTQDRIANNMFKVGCKTPKNTEGHVLKANIKVSEDIET